MQETVNLWSWCSAAVVEAERERVIKWPEAEKNLHMVCSELAEKDEEYWRAVDFIQIAN